MAENYKLNYPVETDTAKKFWESHHRLNRIKCIIAFSLNMDNANDNLRRFGYARQYRKKYLDLYHEFVNNPKMDNSDGKVKVPLSGGDDLWYSPKRPFEDFIYIQNNINNAAANLKPVRIKNSEYTLNPPVAAQSTRYYGAFYRDIDTPDSAASQETIKFPNNTNAVHSSDPSVASVANFAVDGHAWEMVFKKAGKTDITITDKSGRQAVIHVTVS